MVLGVGEQSARTEIDIVFDNEARFEIVFGIRGSDLDLTDCQVGPLLGFEYFVQLSSALFGFEHSTRNDEPLQFIFFFISLSFGK